MGGRNRVIIDQNQFWSLLDDPFQMIKYPTRPVTIFWPMRELYESGKKIVQIDKNRIWNWIKNNL